MDGWQAAPGWEPVALSWEPMVGWVVRFQGGSPWVRSAELHEWHGARGRYAAEGLDGWHGAPLGVRRGGTQQSELGACGLDGGMRL